METRFERAILRAYVENRDALELILLYHVECKQAKQQWFSIITFLYMINRCAIFQNQNAYPDLGPVKTWASFTKAVGWVLIKAGCHSLQLTLKGH